MLNSKYQQFNESLLKFIPEERIFTDHARNLAFGTDASFYQLVPKLVVKVKNEAEVVQLIKDAHHQQIPITFRAAGTSVSGQAISDSVLVALGRGWKNHEIMDNGKRLYMEPGVTGGEANRYLALYKTKLGPDPASINSATIGGITANNSGGLCCGTAQTSYRTLDSMRIVFADGTILDLSDQTSCAEFKINHKEILDQLNKLSNSVKSNIQLADKIREKYKIKNTTGYSLNALIDFEDPFEIIKHLLIGSEGTLGFISSVIYNTVEDFHLKASSLIMFPDIEKVCLAVQNMEFSPAHAVELLDRASLRSIENFDNVPSVLKSIPDNTAALLVETKANTPDILNENIIKIIECIKNIQTLYPPEFSSNPEECERLWNLRKGLFPAIGAMRKTGTTIIIEDIAVPVKNLASATMELQSIFKKYGYDKAIILGHALAGNLHFIFEQDFEHKSEVVKYEEFMKELCQMIVGKYNGSLKSEHGTGLNMAPFVEFEWGGEAYNIMKEIKKIFDPLSILNPGVILNEDKHVHLKNLKPFPVTNDIIDKCIECGYCEINCPSRHLTFSPRQRIALWREITRLRSTGKDKHLLDSMLKTYEYYGEKTCATDGLCATSCPVNIDTGSFIKELRKNNISPFHNKIALCLANNFYTATQATCVLLKIAYFSYNMLGQKLMKRVTNYIRKISGKRFPKWNETFPRAATTPKLHLEKNKNAKKVVYFPSCLVRMMGGAANSIENRNTQEVAASILAKAGYEMVIPENIQDLCCGKSFESKGFFDIAEQKLNQLETFLIKATEDGKLPLLCETSPCLYFMKEKLSKELKLYEPVEFIKKFLINSLSFSKQPKKITVHPTCSTRKMGLEKSLMEIASLCAEEVVIIDEIGCCGFAGDKGFFLPELNASALQVLNSRLPQDCIEGYSTSRPCEIGLSLHGKIQYQSILFLVDESTAVVE